jgi:ribosome-binding factor A
MSFRIQQINKLIRNRIAEILRRELDLKPGIFLTVVKVDTSSDLRYTRISISVFPEKESEYALKTLEKEMYHIQGKLNKKLHLHPLPRIKFALDKTEAKADEIEKILKNI